MAKIDEKTALLDDYETTSQLDNFTDALILEEAGSMENLNAIFSNPTYYRHASQLIQKANNFLTKRLPNIKNLLKQTLRARGGYYAVMHNPATSFPEYALNRKNLKPQGYYVRYWQGFKTPVRFLLCFFSYQQIRKILAYLLFSLFIATTFFIERHADIGSAALFALSIIFVKPQIICNSLQFSTCFILALSSMFFVPYVVKRKAENQFFLVLGMLTMYFDFYTAPLVVMGYPLLFAIILTEVTEENRKNRDSREEENTEKKHVFHTFKYIFQFILSWICGYIFMWFAKLALATCFTPINGFKDGFSTFAQRSGIVKPPALLEYYGIYGAFQALSEAIFPDKLSVLFIFAVILVSVYYSFSISKSRFSYVKSALLLPILTMLIWYCIAAQPTKIHVYFQYRNISMALWAASLLIHDLMLMLKKNGRKREKSIASNQRGVASLLI